MVDVPDGLLDRGVDFDIEDPRWRARRGAGRASLTARERMAPDDDLDSPVLNTPGRPSWIGLSPLRDPCGTPMRSGTGSCGSPGRSCRRFPTSPTTLPKARGRWGSIGSQSEPEARASPGPCLRLVLSGNFVDSSRTGGGPPAYWAGQRTTGSPVGAAPVSARFPTGSRVTWS